MITRTTHNVDGIALEVVRGQAGAERTAVLLAYGTILNQAPLEFGRILKGN